MSEEPDERPASALGAVDESDTILRGEIIAQPQPILLSLAPKPRLTACLPSCVTPLRFCEFVDQTKNNAARPSAEECFPHKIGAANAETFYRAPPEK
jgi:hypothetical protein